MDNEVSYFSSLHEQLLSRSPTAFFWLALVAELGSSNQIFTVPRCPLTRPPHPRVGCPLRVSLVTTPSISKIILSPLASTIFLVTTLFPPTRQVDVICCRRAADDEDEEDPGRLGPPRLLRDDDEEEDEDGRSCFLLLLLLFSQKSPRNAD